MGLRSDFLRHASSYSLYGTDVDYAETLISLAPRLKGSLLNKALDAGRMITAPLLRLKVLIAFIPYVSIDSRAGISRDALKAAALAMRSVLGIHEPGLERSDEQASIYVSTLIELICVLPEHLRSEGAALFVALITDWHGWHPDDLVYVFQKLPTESRSQFLSELLETLLKIRSWSMRASALTSLLPALDNQSRSEVAARALDAAKHITDDFEQIQAITSTISYLAHDMRKSVIKSALQKSLDIRDEGQRVAAVARIAKFIDDPERHSLLDEMLIIATTISSATMRCQALVALISEFSGDRRRRIFEDALTAARGVVKADARYRSIMSLIPIASPAELNSILDESSSITDDGLRGQALARLSPELPPESISRALTIAQTIGIEKCRANALGALCPRLSIHQLDELAISAQDIEDSRNRVLLLKAVIRASRQFSRMAGGYSLPFRVWADGLDRSALFNLISSLAWWAAKSSGGDGMIEISDAILDSTRWWP